MAGLKKITTLFLVVTVFFGILKGVKCTLEVVYALNAGGQGHIDSYGIRYQPDRLQTGVASDFGMRIDIRRALPKDQALYQTERYGVDDFGYDIPIKEDGDYVLVMKFCEVYFRGPYEKVFNVVLDSHVLLSDFDIFREVGYATAHDEYVEFQVKNNGRSLIVGGEKSEISNGRIKLKLIKGSADNPKINAFYVMKGTIQNVPKLIPLEDEEEVKHRPLFDEEEEDEYEDEVVFNSEDFSQTLNVFSTGVGKKIKSGPVHDDPWDDQPPSVVYAPVLGSVIISVVSATVVYSVVGSSYR